jgi:hypothetical protein
MTAAQGGIRRRLLALSIALIAVIPIAALTALQAAGSKPAAGESAAMARLLRLKDLPLGYRLLSFGPSPEYRAQSFTCSAVEPANSQPGLAAFLRRYSPFGCYAIYYRSFRVPGTTPASLAVGTGTMVTGSIEGAEAGLAVAPELLSHLLGDELPEEVAPTTTIGDATRLFHWRHPALFKSKERPDSSFLVWRFGGVVATVFATGGTAAANDRTVLELAQLQQQRVESPVPFEPSELDSSEVALEDPALDIPVFWLGRRFAPGHGLQRLRLLDSASASGAGSLAPRVNLAYVDHPRLTHAETVYLDFWSRSQWKRLEVKRSKPPAVPSCPTAKPLRIAREHLVIYRGFEAGFKGCGDRVRRGAYTARIYLPGVVATAETSMTCAVCARAGTGPYDSRAGMEAIARGLVQRRQAGR